MDNALVEFAQRLPIRHKLADLRHMLSIDEEALRKKAPAQSRYHIGKSILRRAMAPLLPEAVMRRPKQGFGARRLLVSRRKRQLCPRPIARPGAGAG
jgi:asparagine synthase (glutamine-hydrolysing)